MSRVATGCPTASACRVPEQTFGASVPACNDSIQIFTDDRVVGGVHDRAEEQRSTLGLQALSDITRDLRGSDNVPASIFDGRDGQGDIEQTSIFAPAFRLEMLNPLAPPEPRENVQLFLLTIRRNEQSRHWLPNRFGRRVPEQTLRTLVPTGNDSIQIFTDDRVVGGVHDRAEKRRSDLFC